jgi:hypothetical protein
MRLLALLLIPLITFSLISCEEESNESENETLYVKFENETGSEYTITGIRILVMGEAGGEIPEPTGEFSENVLATGEVIAPGGHTFLTLNIPNSNYAIYRLTVDDGTGNQIYLYDQQGYSNNYDGTITHWGGHDRTAYARVVWSETAQYIYVQGYGDFVGIE